MAKKFVVLGVVGVLLAGVVLGGTIFYLSANLPKLSALNDYEPLLVSQVYDINQKKIGEFFRERRILTPIDKIPRQLINAFVAAEDSKFFEHGGVDYMAMVRAALTNIKEGRKAQGASTITQQVARSLLLSPEKTYTRKLREIMLSHRVEANLTKDQILYLYLNQIYLGQGAYGVEIASQSYFRKSVKDLSLAEMAILAGLPQAPTRYSPTSNPQEAKRRQKYVLERMSVEGFIKSEEAKAAAAQPVTVYMREDYQENAPYFLETIRQYLVKELGEATVLDKGIKIFTTLDLDKQLAAQESVQKGLRDLDKKQGYRGAKKNLAQPEEIAEFLNDQKEELLDEKTPIRILNPDGTLTPKDSFEQVKAQRKNVPAHMTIGEIVKGVVTKVDDYLGLVTVRFADAQGLISLESMAWARKPNPKLKLMSETITRPSQALKVGDVIDIKITGDIFHSDGLDKRLAQLKKNPPKGKDPVKDLPQLNQYAHLELEQEPATEAALLSFDIKKQDILAMVGGFDYRRSKFNRAIQAARQTGSSFKPIVYAAALDGGFTPASVIMDAPIVFQDSKLEKMKHDTEEDDVPKVWKPANYGSKFGGDILFRNALIQSKNIPTVRILEQVGIERAAVYARRLGVFSPINMDFTMGLGSSSVTLYEMTKAFSVFANRGKRLRPRMIVSVLDGKGQALIKEVSLDKRFEKELEPLEKDFEEKRQKIMADKKAELAGGAVAPPVAAVDESQKLKNLQKDLKDPNKAPIYFEDPEQLLSPQTSYLMTTLMAGVVNDPNGTGGKARVLGKPVAGKTGSTSDYYDAWFVGFSPKVSTGVWVGYDDERSMGVGATGGEAALPIWIEYMRTVLKDSEGEDFAAPEHIVYANIDNETGKLASANSRRTVRQAFLEGTEPGQAAAPGTPESAPQQEDKDFFKEDLSQ